jgi:predicted DNA-binding protein
MANHKADTKDLKIRVPNLIKKSLDELAKREANSTNAIVRRFITDGIRDEKEKNRK